LASRRGARDVAVFERGHDALVLGEDRVGAPDLGGAAVREGAVGFEGVPHLGHEAEQPLVRAVGFAHGEPLAGARVEVFHDFPRCQAGLSEARGTIGAWQMRTRPRGRCMTTWPPSTSASRR
jgi:hypothetical protein